MYCLLTLVWHYVAILSILATIEDQDHITGQQNQCLIICSMTALIPNFTGYPMFDNKFKWQPCVKY